MRTQYQYKTGEEIYRLWQNPPDFSATRVIELTISPMGLPIVDGVPITTPQDWFQLMTSNKFIVFQGTRQYLDASLKPILSLAQVQDLYMIGEVMVGSDEKVRTAASRIKLERKFGIDGRPQRVHRLVNIAGFCPEFLPPQMLQCYPVAYYEEMKKYGIPVTDLISPAATMRNTLLLYSGYAFWNLEAWIEEDPKREEILEFFRRAAPAPIQETSLVGHETGTVKCLDFVTNHLLIGKTIPLMVPGHTTLNFEPGYSPSDIHGAHEISVFIVPGRHKFSPIIQRFGDSGTPIPIVGQVDHAEVTQQTIEDLLWSGYDIKDITFHKSVRVQLRSGRKPIYAFSDAFEHINRAVEGLSEVFSPQAHYQTAGGNFLGTYIGWKEGKPIKITLPTYNPLYWSYLRGKAWSLVWKLSEVLENPINRNPDEVYTTDKEVPNLIDGFPLREKRSSDAFVQFDPYLKSTIGLGPSLVDFAQKHPDNKTITITREVMAGLGEVAESKNLFVLGTKRPVSVTIRPSGGARDLEEEVPNLGYILEKKIRALNIRSGKATRVADKVGRYGREVSKILDK
jgi:hypothetical protein